MIKIMKGREGIASDVLSPRNICIAWKGWRDVLMAAGQVLITDLSLMYVPIVYKAYLMLMVFQAYVIVMHCDFVRSFSSYALDDFHVISGIAHIERKIGYW